MRKVKIKEKQVPYKEEETIKEHYSKRVIESTKRSICRDKRTRI
ncbi:3067_t:CDS:1, partial [Gigaspora margarita]